MVPGAAQVVIAVVVVNSIGMPPASPWTCPGPVAGKFILVRARSLYQAPPSPCTSAWLQEFQVSQEPVPYPKKAPVSPAAVRGFRASVRGTSAPCGVRAAPLGKASGSAPAEDLTGDGVRSHVEWEPASLPDQAGDVSYAMVEPVSPEMAIVLRASIDDVMRRMGLHEDALC